MPTVNVPKGFNPKAHIFFIHGKINTAINTILNELKETDDFNRFFQLAYYYQCLSKYDIALVYYEKYFKYIFNKNALVNAAICCNLSGKFSQCIKYCNYIISKSNTSDSDCVLAYRCLAHAFGCAGKINEACEAGTQALLLKNKKCDNKSFNFISFTSESENKYLLSADKKNNVCSFSLFGSNPRYLRGALYNVIIGKELFPEWTMRFYVDMTVPNELKDALKSLNAEILEQKNNQPIDRKLCWRFFVASDPEVGRFIVRDCDSTFGLREVIIVNEWIDSGKIFHIIRDWHTHTYLMLAGLWGGVSNIITNVEDLIDQYLKIHIGLSRNIDQDFLETCIWPIAKKSCFIHDRYFNAFSPRRPPMKHFRTKNDHIGSNRFVVDRDWQEKCLAPWIRELPCLQIQPAKNK